MRTAVACPEPPDQSAPVVAPATYTFTPGALAGNMVVAFWPCRPDPERRARIQAKTLAWWAGR